MDFSKTSSTSAHLSSNPPRLVVVMSQKLEAKPRWSSSFWRLREPSRSSCKREPTWLLNPFGNWTFCSKSFLLSKCCTGKESVSRECKKSTSLSSITPLQYWMTSTWLISPILPMPTRSPQLLKSWKSKTSSTFPSFRNAKTMCTNSPGWWSRFSQDKPSRTSPRSSLEIWLHKSSSPPTICSKKTLVYWKKWPKKITFQKYPVSWK